MLCVKCQKRPAVVFVQRLENGKPVQEGYCLTCARAMHIQPVDDLMKQFGMSDQDLENMEERMGSFLQEAADSGMLAPMMGSEEAETGDDAAARSSSTSAVSNGRLWASRPSDNPPSQLMPASSTRMAAPFSPAQAKNSRLNAPSTTLRSRLGQIQ